MTIAQLRLQRAARALMSAYGYTAEDIAHACEGLTNDEDVALHLTTLLEEERAWDEELL